MKSEPLPAAEPAADAREASRGIGAILAVLAADAFLALAALALAEIVVVALVSWSRLIGLLEGWRAVERLLPLGAAAAAPTAVAVAAFGAILVRAGQDGSHARDGHAPRGGRGDAHAPPAAPRVALAIFAAMFAGLTAAGVSTGRHFEAIGVRAAFVVALALGAGAGAYFAAPPLGRAVAWARGPRLAAALVGVVVAVELANVLVLPRLYPAFHWALAAAALAVAGLVPLAWREGRERLAPRFSTVRITGCALGALTALALVRPASKALALGDNIRLIYLERGPLTGLLVRGAALIAPPVPIDDAPLVTARSGHAVDMTGRDVLLISVDALRADHVGAYGYSRPTTPHLDALAKDSVVFEAAYTPTPHTSYAVTSLMTGKYMRPLLLQGLGADSETWAQHLRRYGWRTAAFYPPAVFFIDGERFAPFRDNFLGFEYRKVEFAVAHKRADQVRAYLARDHEGRRLFLWVHLFEPHEPYQPHPELCDATGAPGEAVLGGEAAPGGASPESPGAAGGSGASGALPQGPAAGASPQGAGAATGSGASASAEEVRRARCGDGGAPFGERDVDRYDAEIAAADAGIGEIVAAVRAARPNAIVIVTADHGEEFGEHGGRYHGTTVYEEQVRVPLVVSAPGLFAPRRVPQPVQIIDLLPTVLAGLDIPRPARVRGTDLGPWLAGKPPPAGFEDGFAFAETDEQTMLARGALRLVCARKVGACALHDLATDPNELRDDTAAGGPQRETLRAELSKIEASHGTFELSGLRTEGKGWPPALRRGIAGDADAASDVAALLDDADVVIRRKAAEVLYDLRRPETAAGLRLAVVRDEDAEVRTRAALALTRLGEGAARTRELLDEPDVPLRRLAALALAEQGDTSGEDELVAWWRKAHAKDPAERDPLPEARGKEILAALGHIKSEKAVYALISSLDDVRLRPFIAEALAAIGEDAARPALAEQLAVERYQTARVAIVKAMLALGAEDEMARPLARLLGMPDPLPDGLEYAMKAGVLQHVGGPRQSDLSRLVRLAKAGAPLRLVVPKVEKNPRDRGLRAICRARTTDGAPGEIRLGRVMTYAKGRYSAWIPKAAPELDPDRSAVLRIEPGNSPGAMKEVYAGLPAAVGLKQGDLGEFVVYATQNVEVAACAVVALQDEIPPPPPQPWTPAPEEDAPP